MDLKSVLNYLKANLNNKNYIVSVIVILAAVLFVLPKMGVRLWTLFKPKRRRRRQRRRIRYIYRRRR